MQGTASHTTVICNRRDYFENLLYQVNAFEYLLRCCCHNDGIASATLDLGPSSIS